MRARRFAWALLVALLLPAGAHAASVIEGRDLRLVGAYDAPKGLDGGAFGGLSGLDYDARSGLWLMISDDKSEHGPARFYRVRLAFDDRAVTGLAVEAAVPLRRADASTFPAARDGRGEVADAEAIRIDPHDRSLLWASEGDPVRGFDPAVRRMAADGAPRGAVPLPPMLRFDPSGAAGPRANLTVEGLAYAPDGRSLWVAMEGPLIQDGPPASLTAGGLSRLTALDRRGRPLAQYAYRLDSIPARPAGQHADNGVSEILAADDHTLLVLERSGVQGADGAYAFHIRLYAAELRGAENVIDRPSLTTAPVRPLTKRLLLDFDSLAGTKIDNLEGMAWGPRLRGGARSLVLVSDDNFDPRQKTQVLVFALRRGGR